MYVLKVFRLIKKQLNSTAPIKHLWNLHQRTCGQILFVYQIKALRWCFKSACDCSTTRVIIIFWFYHQQQRAHTLLFISNHDLMIGLLVFIYVSAPPGSSPSAPPKRAPFRNRPPPHHINLISFWQTRTHTSEIFGFVYKFSHVRNNKLNGVAAT